MPLTVCTSLSLVSNTIMFSVEDFRNFQVRMLGSEARYRRVNTKLANLEVDPLFYLDQLTVFRWRMTFLQRRRGVCPEDWTVWSYMATKCFVEAVEADVQGPNLPDGWQGLSDEASSKFGVPLQVLQPLASVREHRVQAQAFSSCNLARGHRLERVPDGREELATAFNDVFLRQAVRLAAEPELLED